MQFLSFFANISRRPAYWLAIAVIALGALGVALYYQYIDGVDPCILCVHVRLWTCAFVIIGLIGMFLCRFTAGLLIVNALSVVAAIGFFERSYTTFGVERGFIESSCAMSLGLPDWLAVDRWFPALFEALGMCGLTPELFWGITMADALLVGGGAALLLTVLCFTATALRQLKLIQ